MQCVLNGMKSDAAIYCAMMNCPTLGQVVHLELLLPKPAGGRKARKAKRDKEAKCRNCSGALACGVDEYTGVRWDLCPVAKNLPHLPAGTRLIEQGLVAESKMSPSTPPPRAARETR